ERQTGAGGAHAAIRPRRGPFVGAGVRRGGQGNGQTATTGRARARAVYGDRAGPGGCSREIRGQYADHLSTVAVDAGVPERHRVDVARHSHAHREADDATPTSPKTPTLRSRAGDPRQYGRDGGAAGTALSRCSHNVVPGVSNI